MSEWGMTGEFAFNCSNDIGMIRGGWRNPVLIRKVLRARGLIASNETPLARHGNHWMRANVTCSKTGEPRGHRWVRYTNPGWETASVEPSI